MNAATRWYRWSLLLWCFAGGIASAQSGPDVTVFTLSSVGNYGAAGGIRGYSVGTVSCNIGTQPLNWCDNAGGCGLGTTSADHPVIAQNVYRLKNDRFEQIGASWLKHGFVSTNSSQSGCGTGSCQAPPLGGNQLGVGCTDPYGSGLNGSRPLGRRSEVNATTGVFPHPIGGGGSTAQAWNQRMAVAEVDVDPALNGGARYFVEGHYVAPDDAASGNALNNASYREVLVSGTEFNLLVQGTTVRQRAAIQGWQAIDPTVQLVNVDVPGAIVQRFHVARKVIEVTPGTLWRYEYAVHNLNSDRSADRLGINFAGATIFSNIGFRDVNSHSNEPYDTADWPVTTNGNLIQWQAPVFTASPSNGNAIRWGTMYSFWFEANRPPEQISGHTLRLFTPGSPGEMQFEFRELFGNGFE